VKNNNRNRETKRGYLQQE